MTALPYITSTAGTISLNDGAGATGTVCQSEDINKTQPMLSASAAGGDTRDNLLATLMSGTRTISIRGIAEFSSQNDLNSWFQSIDSLVIGASFTSVKYYAQAVTAPYSGGNAYFNGFITDFKISKVDDEGGGYKLNYVIEFTEGLGLDG